MGLVSASRFLRIMDPYMAGPDVLALQQRLRQLGFYKGDIDSVYGPQTEAAVKAFQKSRGLQEDGIVGPNTWSAIGLGTTPATSTSAEQTGYNIVVDIEEIQLYLKRGNSIVKVYPCAVGRPETPSPVGYWTIVQKTMDPGGAFGTRWMRLSCPWGGYGIHGTDNPNSIGTAASHGCIRMYNRDAEAVYDLVPLGTPVRVIGPVFTGRTLYVGVSNGSDIAEVQQRLQVMKFYKGDIDGAYGPQTRDAVTAFQRAHELTPDGVAGPQTLERLQRVWDQITDNRTP
jgi:L,D-transpeptidase ErfK/SrfK